MADLILRAAALAALDQHAHGGGQTYRSITLEVAVEAIRALPAVAASQTSYPAVKADPLGAEWMRREIIRHCEDGWPNDEGQNVYFSGGDGIAHKIKTTIPGPTDADLDAATLARPKVKALMEALTPSSDTKAAYMGEIIDPETKRTVSWTAIKMVMKMIAERAAAKSGDA